jgi:hypothetical protein
LRILSFGSGVFPAGLGAHAFGFDGSGLSLSGRSCRPLGLPPFPPVFVFGLRHGRLAQLRPIEPQSRVDAFDRFDGVDVERLSPDPQVWWCSEQVQDARPDVATPASRRMDEVEMLVPAFVP